MKWKHAVLGAGLAAVVAGTPNAAWSQNRPDLPDVGNGLTPSAFAKLDATAGLKQDELSMSLVAQSYTAINAVYFARIVINPALTQFAAAQGALYEADKVTRQFDKQVLVQGNFPGVAFLAGTVTNLNTNPTTSNGASQAAGCKVKGKVNTFDPVNIEYDTGVGVVACSDAGLNAIVANPAGRARLKALLGVQSNGTGVKAKGSGIPHV